MQNFQRREFKLVDDLVVFEHELRAASRPIEVFNRPMHEDPLKGLGLGQTDGSVFFRVSQCQQRSAQQRGMRQIGMIIRKGCELDHGLMVPRSGRGFQR